MSPNLHRRPGDGPTPDEFANAAIIGGRQADAAARLAAQAVPAMPARVAAVALQAGLAEVAVSGEFTPDGRPHHTGQACAGTSTLAGAWADGKGFARFREGGGRRLDRLFAATVYRMRPRFAAAQAPKTVVLSGKLLNRRVPFVAESGDFQLLRIGDLHLLAVPLEVTIVAGLRLRRTVAEVVGADVDDVLVCGYSNGYLHYLTTPEEYLDQQYEGGSTLFGRWELPAVMQVAHRLASGLAADPARRAPPQDWPTSAPRAPSRPPPGADTRPTASRPTGPTVRPARAGSARCLRPPRTRYRPGDRAIVEFRSGNPNNEVGRHPESPVASNGSRPVGGATSPVMLIRRRCCAGVARVALPSPAFVGRFRSTLRPGDTESATGRRRGPARGELVRIEAYTDPFDVGPVNPTGEAASEST